MSADRLKLLLSFAAGGLLGDVFLLLLPEALNPVNAGKLITKLFLLLSFFLNVDSN